MLIVEDGSQVSNAESYISVADADAYFTSIDKFDAWDAADNKEAVLRIATFYMTSVYRQRWAGYRYTVTQALDWPRSWVPVPDTIISYGPYPYYLHTNVVPDVVKRACAELAFRAITDDIIPDLTREDFAKSVKISSLQIEYNLGAPSVVVYRQVDAMLAFLFKGQGGMTKLVRT